MQFKQSVRAACRESFDGEDALFANATAEEELRQLFRAIDSDSDGFIGTKEYKAFLVGCTSAFLSDIGPESDYAAAPDKRVVNMDSSDDLSLETHGLLQQQGPPSTMLLRRRRRGQDTSAAVGWMAPTSASQAMCNRSSMPNGRDSLGGPKPVRRRSQGSEGIRGGVMLTPLVDATASFLRPTRVSRLGQREKHRFDQRDLRYKSSSTRSKQTSDQATVPRRAASAMELQPSSQRDRRRSLSKSSQQLSNNDRAQPLAKPRTRAAFANSSVPHQNDVDAEDIVDEETNDSFSETNSPVGTRSDERKQGGVDQVMLKLKTKAARRKKNAVAAAASLSDTNGPDDETKEENTALNSSEESLQPWEKKQKKPRGPPLTGARIEITPIEVDLSSVAVVAPKVDKVMMMMKAKEEKKKKQKQELVKSKTKVDVDGNSDPDVTKTATAAGIEELSALEAGTKVAALQTAATELPENEPEQTISANAADENSNGMSQDNVVDEGIAVGDAPLDKSESDQGETTTQAPTGQVE